MHITPFSGSKHRFIAAKRCTKFNKNIHISYLANPMNVRVTVFVQLADFSIINVINKHHKNVQNIAEQLR